MNLSNRKAPVQTPQREGGEVVTELNEQDVLFGRGAVSHRGNVQFRRIISSRREEYWSTNRRMYKEWIALQVISTVEQMGGRFLKAIDSEAESQQLPAFSPPNAWRVVDEATVLLKVKQALRERDSGKDHKRGLENSLSRPTKRHRDDTSSLPVSAGVHLMASHSGSTSTGTGLTSPQEVDASAATPAMEAPGPRGTNALPGIASEGLTQQPRRHTSFFTNTSPIPRPIAITGPPQSQLLRTNIDPSMQVLRALSERRLQTPGIVSDNLRNFSPESMSLDTLIASLRRYGQRDDIPFATEALAPPMRFPQMTGPEAHASQPESAFGRMGASAARENLDRLEALFDAQYGASNVTTLSTRPDGASTSETRDRIIPRGLLTGGTRESSSLLHLEASSYRRRGFPSFFPNDIRNESRGIQTLFDSMHVDRRFVRNVHLSFSLTEMLILAALCSFGIPIWNAASLDHGEMFLPTEKTTHTSSRYHLSWFDFGLLLEEAAKDWRDRQYQAGVPQGFLAKMRSDVDNNLEKRAADICASYSKDCRQLAKSTLCILEKMRCFLIATQGTAPGVGALESINPSIQHLTSNWVKKEIKRWSETLECQAGNGMPVAYTASDFLVSHPEEKENSSYKLVSFCDKEACTTIWNQVALLSYTRSTATAVPTAGSLAAKLESIIQREGAPAWQDMPHWWSLNTLYFDVELLKLMLLNGYVGVLCKDLSSPTAAPINTEPMTFSRLGVTSKSLLQERFEQLAGLFVKSEEHTALMEQLLNPLYRRRLEDRIETFQGLI